MYRQSLYMIASTISVITLGASKSDRLSREHRTWVALYALGSGKWTLADTLRLNDVTEADLAEFEASWLRLRCRHTSLVA